MVVVMHPVAYRVEAVVVANVKIVSEIHYICDSFTCNAVNCLSGETNGQMLYDLLRYLYIGGDLNRWRRYGCGCRCLYGYRCGTGFRRRIGICGFSY